MPIPFNIENLISLKKIESNRVQFLKSWDQLKILHWICAYANDYEELNGGFIIVGINKDTQNDIIEITGLTDEDIKNIKIEIPDLYEMINPKFNRSAEIRKYKNKFLLLINIPSGLKRPYKVPESLTFSAEYKCFISDNNCLTTIHDNFFTSFLKQNNNFCDSYIENSSLKDINKNLLIDFLKFTNNPLYQHSNNYNLEEILRFLSLLIYKENKLYIRNIALILFNDHPNKIFPGTYIKLQLYDKNENKIDENIFNGPIHYQVKNILTFINKNFIEKKVIENNIFYNYPISVLEEIITHIYINKFFHIDIPIEINLYKTFIEITSYSGIEIKNNEIQSSPYTNKRIADYFKQLGITSLKDQHYKKIFTILKKNNSTFPSFSKNTDNNFFKIILNINPIFLTDNETKKESEKLQEYSKKPTIKKKQKYTKTEKKIISLLQNRSCSSSEIFKVLGHSKLSGSIKQSIKNLLNLKIIEYTIPEKPRSKLQKYKLKN